MPAWLDRIPENGLFWIALLLLSMGAVTTFYYQGNIAMRTMSHRIYTEASTADVPEGRILTIYDTDTGTPRTIILTDDTGVLSNP